MIDKILLTTSAIDCVSMHNYWLNKQHWKIPEPQRARSRSARYCCWSQQHTCFQWKHDNNVECPTTCLAPCRCLTSRMASLWWWASVNHRKKEKTIQVHSCTWRVWIEWCSFACCWCHRHQHRRSMRHAQDPYRDGNRTSTLPHREWIHNILVKSDRVMTWFFLSSNEWGSKMRQYRDLHPHHHWHLSYEYMLWKGIPRVVQSV